MNLIFSEGHWAWKGKTLLASVLFFFPTFSQLEETRLARSFRALEHWKKASPSFSRRTLPAAVWSAPAVEICRIGGTLAAVLTMVMFEAYLRPGEILSLQPSSLPAPAESGVRNRLRRLFPRAGNAWSKTGEADDTISLDSKQRLWMEPIFERLHRRQPQDRPLLTMNYAEYFLLFRRARANLQIDVVPCQGRHFGASVDRAKNSRTLQSIQKPGRWLCAATKKTDGSTKAGQCSLPCCRRTASIAKNSWRQSCFMVTPLRHRRDCFAFSAQSFCPNTDLQRFFLNKGVQCARLDPLPDDSTVLSARIREILCILASGRILAVMLSPPIFSLSVARSRRPLRGVTKPWGLQHLSRTQVASKCAVWDIHHCAFGSHWRETTRLVFGGQTERARFHVLASYVFRCHGKHGFCSFREGHKHLLLQGSLTRQSAKYPPRLVAFIAVLLMDP